jgi:hypothetical protein
LRRYACWFTGTVAGVLTAIAVVNWAVDPLHVYRLPWSQSLAAYKPRAIDRISKAETARSVPLDAVLLGDSRVLRGFDPRHPALTAHGRSYNLGVSAGSIYEATRMLELCLDRHPPRVVVWSLPPELVETDRRQRTSFDYELSRLNPRLNLVLHHAHNLWGRDVLWASRKVVKNWWNRATTGVVDGFEPDRQIPDDPYALFRLWLPTASEPTLAAMRPAEAVQQTLDRIDSVLGRAQSCGTQVVLLFPPVHAAYLEGLAQLNQWDAYERGKQRIVELVERHNASAAERPAIMVWDFSAFHGLTAEPPPSEGRNQPMQWFLDPLHFRETLGEMVLNRVFQFGVQADDFGVALTTSNLARHLAEQARDRARYRSESRDVVRLASEQARVIR